MTKHTDLIARLEALTGPDREVDWRIAESLGDIPPHSIREVGFDYDWYRRPNEFALWKATDSEGRSADRWQPKPVTASIDAAVALCERVLPGWIWLRESPDTMTVCEDTSGKGLAGFVQAYHPLPAIALLIATLKALDAKEQSDD